MLGYAYNNGGLNNQKMALLGLMAAAHALPESQREVALPDLYNFTVEKLSIDRLPFSDHFYEEPLREVMARYGISVVPSRSTWDDEGRIIKCGWNYFRQSSEIIRALSLDRSGAPASFAAAFLRSLIPRISHSEEFAAVASKLFLHEGVSVVAQLRVESDWVTHSINGLKGRLSADEDYCISADQIIAKIRNTLGDTGPIYVTCNERYLPSLKDEIRKTVKEKTGADIIFKSDIVAEDIGGRMGNFSLSVFDFEIAKMAPIFVGLTRSTFANMLALERFVTGFSATKRDYAYNLPGAALGLRTDFGTQTSPEAAVKAGAPRITG